MARDGDDGSDAREVGRTDGSGAAATAETDPVADAESYDYSWPGVYLRGVCMGAADAVPGVSGGTIALITGIYDRLIAAVTAVGPDVGRDALAGVTGDRGRLRAAVERVDLAFLLVLGAGIFTAVLTVTRALHVAIEGYPAPTFGFFFGLIAASAFVLRHEVYLDTARRKGAAVAGFLLAFLVSGSASAALPDSPATTAFAGAFAVSAMILPGISGSLILVILGQYERMSGALSTFQDRLLDVATGADVSVLVDPGTTVVSFMVGAVVGLLTVAHGVRRALERDRETTLTFLVALVVGALRAPVASAGENLGELGRAWTGEAVLLFAVAAVVGAVLVVALDRVAGGIEL